MVNTNTRLVLAGLVALAAAQAPPSPVRLTSTKSGVLPVAPTPFDGVDTIEGAITYDGPPLPGFIGPGGPAAVQSNLPAATYTAVLPSTNFDNLTGSIITGTISGSSQQGANGVLFNINFTGFPSAASYGPFVYHIHALPIMDGNCTTSMGHLDPTNRGELHACDTSAPQTCQAGDLAGKHGNITAASFTASFTDPYLSTDPSSQYFFGDKSIVIHASNTTRLTCANFVRAGAGGSNGTSSNGTSGGGSSATGSSGSAGSGSSTAGAGGSSPSGQSTNAAALNGNSGGVALMAVVVAMAFLLL